VLLRVMSCGLCGTDIKLFKGEYAASLPLCRGMRCRRGGARWIAGEGLQENDRVVIDPNLPCANARGAEPEPATSANNPRFGVTERRIRGVHGGCREASASHRPGLDYVAASLTEPLSCAVHAVDRAG